MSGYNSAACYIVEQKHTNVSKANNHVKTLKMEMFSNWLKLKSIEIIIYIDSFVTLYRRTKTYRFIQHFKQQH